MAVNKVTYGGETLIDLTGDTVTADKLAQGITAHDASGAEIVGTMVASSGSKVKAGSINLAETKTFSVTHGLGVTPSRVLLVKLGTKDSYEVVAEAKGTGLSKEWSAAGGQYGSITTMNATTVNFSANYVYYIGTYYYIIME